jgi:hypothetical protein
MLPPVLEVHVVWHPGDGQGREIAKEFVEHFHGTAFSGLIGGAIEVYVRSEGWGAVEDAPRPIPFKDGAASPGLRAPRFVAVVPLVGNEMATATETENSAWHKYLQNIVDARNAEPQRVGVFPYLVDAHAMNKTRVGKILQKPQRIAANPPSDGETLKMARCRDLTQGIATLVSQSDKRLTVFISHTKRNSAGEGESVTKIIATVREILAGTRLGGFFDANDLEPGEDWDQKLRQEAGSSALLAIRTDLYPSREWCQREIAIAKRAGMPVLIVDALGDAEERGSFLMDHVPRVPARAENNQWRRQDIHRALALLVDECAKRALWNSQQKLAQQQETIKVSWWAPHAPEPITLTHWLGWAGQKGALPGKGEDLVILHPDPPLGPEETEALQEILTLSGIQNRLDVMTPRLLAARGG